MTTSVPSLVAPGHQDFRRSCYTTQMFDHGVCPNTNFHFETHGPLHNMHCGMLLGVIYGCRSIVLRPLISLTHTTMPARVGLGLVSNAQSLSNVSSGQLVSKHGLAVHQLRTIS